MRKSVRDRQYRRKSFNQNILRLFSCRKRAASHSRASLNFYLFRLPQVAMKKWDTETRDSRILPARLRSRYANSRHMPENR
jgi:hypothetical protein